ncbi:MAG: damage-inducible protein DinB [Thermoleophilia bacterium]|nr:damage-inducible protein DinB [Thermoleophilia bacterium]
MIPAYYVQTMAAYNAEMNRRVYGAALRLDDADRRADMGLFWRSIHGTLSHLCWADRVWMARFGLGAAPAVAIRDSGGMEEDFDRLWAARQGLDADMIDWAASYDPSQSEGMLEWWSGAANRQMAKPRALCLMQVFNHQTHHRGQVHAALTRLGESTGDTDLPFVLPDWPERSNATLMTARDEMAPP